jgi:hypothetical protein
MLEMGPTAPRGWVCLDAPVAGWTTHNNTIRVKLERVLDRHRGPFAALPYFADVVANFSHALQYAMRGYLQSRGDAMRPEIKAAAIAYQPTVGFPAWHVIYKFCGVMLALTVPSAKNALEARQIAAKMLWVS